MIYRTNTGWEHSCFGISRFWGVPPHASWGTLVFYLKIQIANKSYRKERVKNGCEQ